MFINNEKTMRKDFLRSKTSSERESFSKSFSAQLGATLLEIHGDKTAEELLKIYPELVHLKIHLTTLRNTQPSQGTAGLDHLADKLLDLSFRWQTKFGGDTRSSNGMFFTPTKELVSAYNKLVQMEPELRVLDPACGSGSLSLAYLYWALKKSTKNIPRIYGFDLNPELVAVSSILTRAMLAIFEPTKFRTIAKSNFQFEVSSIEQMISIKAGSFDVVVMNPPFVRGGGNTPFMKGAQSFGGGNLTNSFYALAFHALHKKGRALFVFGEPVKWGFSYRDICSSLVNDWNILWHLNSIENFDQIQYETFSVVAERKSEKQKSNPFTARLQSVTADTGSLALQLNKLDLMAWKNIQPKTVKLAGLIKQASRGVYTKLPICAGKNPNFIPSGRFINAYTINSIFKIEPTKSIWKDVFNQKRILIKAKRGKLLQATYCSEGIATTDNITNMVVNEKSMSTLCLLGVLNSSFVSYYLNTFIFCGNSESARILDGVYLERIRIPKLSSAEQKKIEISVKKIMAEVKKHSNVGWDTWHLEVGRDHQEIEDRGIMNEAINVESKKIDRVIFKRLSLPRMVQANIEKNFGRVFYYMKAEVSQVINGKAA